METPSSSSSRVITRTQALAMAMAANNNKPICSRKNEEESEKGVMKSRSALIDITNDSPIIGLATGSLKTPSSTFSKKRMIILNTESKQATTPGSGEALLRNQVKTLLQKVEEEALISKISFEPRNLVNFPNVMYLVAPTPANTPQFSDNSNNGSESLKETLDFSQMIDHQQEENEETLITKLLFTEFPEKLEGYDSCLDDEEDDDSSVWSVEVNASTSDEHEDDQELEVSNEDGEVGELCEVMSKICVNGGANFSGKIKRFVYDSDGELEHVQTKHL